MSARTFTFALAALLVAGSLLLFLPGIADAAAPREDAGSEAFECVDYDDLTICSWASPGEADVEACYTDELVIYGCGAEDEMTAESETPGETCVEVAEWLAFDDESGEWFPMAECA